MRLFSWVLYGYTKKKTVVTTQTSSHGSDLKKSFFSTNLSFLPYAFNFYNYLCKKRK